MCRLAVPKECIVTPSKIWAFGPKGRICMPSPVIPLSVFNHKHFKAWPLFKSFTSMLPTPLHLPHERKKKKKKKKSHPMETQFPSTASVNIPVMCLSSGFTLGKVILSNSPPCSAFHPFHLDSVFMVCAVG